MHCSNSVTNCLHSWICEIISGYNN